MTTEGNILLAGTVGSTAYGLDHDGSDVDTLAVFAAPSDDFFGLHPVRETYVMNGPDVTVHEVAKFVRLVMKGNPSVTELLWLPTGLYQTMTPLGYELMCLRTQMTAAPRVRTSYLGFASGQVDRIRNRLARPMDHAERAKVAKHARHLARLVMQGFELYSTARLTVQLDDEAARRCREFGERVAGGAIEDADALMSEYAKRFDWCVPALPKEPDEYAVERWVRDMRRRLLTDQPAVRALAAHPV